MDQTRNLKKQRHSKHQSVNAQLTQLKNVFPVQEDLIDKQKGLQMKVLVQKRVLSRQQSIRQNKSGRLERFVRILQKPYKTISDLEEGEKLFDNLASEKKKELLNHLKYKIYDDQGVVFRKGEKSQEFYIILSGCVLLYEEIIEQRDGNFQKVAKQINSLTPGMSFGERGILINQPRSLNAKCIGVTEIISINKDEFLFLLRKDFKTS